METGDCLTTECLPGYHGTTCSDVCSERCRANDIDGLVYCNVTDGQCDNGCVDGWYGQTCDNACSTTCKGDVITCARDGFCINGCVRDKYGDLCEKDCISTCIDDQCDQAEGFCLDCLEPKTISCRDAGIMTSYILALLTWFVCCFLVLIRREMATCL